jgi:hypothetical protein
MLQPRTFNQIAKVHIDNKIRKLYCPVLITLRISQYRENGLGLSKNLFGLLNSKSHVYTF